MRRKLYPKREVILNYWMVFGWSFIIITGAAWHFVYELSGNNKIIALIAPMNESVWEHLKMGYWPMIFYSVFEFQALKGKVNNFLPGKLAAVVILNATIVTIFCSYTYFTGHSILWVDIGSFIAGVTLGQFALDYFFHLSPFSKKNQILSGLIFLLIGVLFAIFTYYPPHWPIFMDHVTHGYGITI